MSKYTTGEIAKLCGVTVRTVQYYDTRGILVPNELSEGGRRLYSDDDLQKMKTICFLRDVGVPINAIAGVLSEEHPEKILSILLDQQKEVLKDEINEKHSQLEKVEALQKHLQNKSDFSVKSLGDIASQMENKKKLRKVRRNMIAASVPILIIELTAIISAIVLRAWWPILAYIPIGVIFGILISRHYLKNIAYICPECHAVFKPAFKEVFWANHTPTTRKLTCPECGHHGFCVETYGGNI